ncbi:MAG: hypothetical protein IJF83_01650 [Methanobrevibacter sp.]|nr:hypothetical protein [Methanobrevibacter sp.]
MGSVCAVDVNGASNTEDSNLTTDNVNSLSSEKLEVSSDDSISETNLVNSHDDNLNDYPEDSLLASESYYEDNTEPKLGLVNEDSEIIAVSNDDSIVNVNANDNVLAAGKVSTSLSVSDAYYDSSATCFKVTLQDQNGKTLSKQKISLIVKGKKYNGTTNSNGAVYIKTAALAVGTYNVSIYYSGSSTASSTSLSKKVTVKKDKTKFEGKAKTYILTNYYHSYTVTLLSENGGPIENCKVYFSYANKTVTATTDSKGKASTVIPLLEEGTYKISYKFKGTDGYYASSSSGTIVISPAVNKFNASDLTMNYKGGSSFKVKFTDNNGKILSGKTITFKLNNKTYTSKTNSKGIASLAIGNLKPGTYQIKYFYSTIGEKEYNYGYNKITVNKLSAKLSAKDMSMNYKDGSEYKVTVKDASGNVLKNTKVKFTVNGKSYIKQTNSKGIAKLAINLPVGYYSVYAAVSSGYYKGSVTRHILINGTQFDASDSYVAIGKTAYYSVKLIDGKNKPIKGATVKFTINGKSYNKVTDSNGVAKVNAGVLSAGNHKIKYSSGSTSGSSTIHVVNKVTIKQIIAASKNVKSYIEDNNKLPATVKIGSVTYSLADYLYLASKAIVSLNASKKSDIPYKSIKAPSKPGAATSKGNLYNYLAVAKSIIKTADSKGQMPNYVSSDVGSLGYKGVVYAFARVVAFYGNENVMPAYVTVKSLSSSSSTSSLNSKNTITNLELYLAASTNCQVNNTKIKQLVTKLTKGLTSDRAKAIAIYNYVRDAVSYSFYYDTRYGAVGTLNAKTGNCVDHSHLLVAMYRTAGLPARYVHGTCTFTSGTYGHVWTQVLIGDTWIVSDATSARNSFGNVVNWNANSYSLKGYYPSIAF